MVVLLGLVLGTCVCVCVCMCETSVRMVDAVAMKEFQEKMCYATMQGVQTRLYRSS